MSRLVSSKRKQCEAFTELKLNAILVSCLKIGVAEDGGVFTEGFWFLE